MTYLYLAGDRGQVEMSRLFFRRDEFPSLEGGRGHLVVLELLLAPAFRTKVFFVSLFGIYERKILDTSNQNVIIFFVHNNTSTTALPFSTETTFILVPLANSISFCWKCFLFSGRTSM